MGKKADKALLALEDGTVFWGRRLGAEGETFGEFVFNTGMTGYQEVLTDPSYRGQVVVMTYPEIGIYGVNEEDPESAGVQVAGFVVHRAVARPHNQRATQGFATYLEERGVVALEGVDTRALARHLRAQGAMRGAISTEDLNPERLVARVQASPSMCGWDLAQAVSPNDAQVRAAPATTRARVAVLDAGSKAGIVRDLARRGVEVTVVPHDAALDDVLALSPDGVMLSNGPGDPAPLDATVALIRGLLAARVPLAGICLGHQLLSLALGATTYKMCFGHRGANHPVKDLLTGRVQITTQNHGFAVDPTSLGIPWAPLDAAFEPARPALLAEQELDARAGTMAERLPTSPLVGESPAGFGAVEVTHLSLNDGTVEGLRLRERPAFSVQFHPEASPGPHDVQEFFDAFFAMLEVEHA